MSMSTSSTSVRSAIYSYRSRASLDAAKELAELRQLQEARKSQEQAGLQAAIEKAAESIPFFENGFEFSRAEMENRLAQRKQSLNAGISSTGFQEAA